MTDILVTWMKNHNVPLTRGAYLALAFPEGEPDPWTEEDEMMLPPEVQFGRAEIDAFIQNIIDPLLPDGRDPHTQHIIRTFYEAINHIDQSEPLIRDMIESELMDVAGINRTKVSAAITAGNNVAKKIAALRKQHIIRAFRHLRKHLPSDI